MLWGLYFFVLLVIERFTRKYLEKIPGVLRWAATFLLLVIGWNIFYFTDGTRLLESFRVMLGAAGTGFADEQLRISFINNLPLLILCILGSTPLPQIVGNTFGMLCASKDGGGKKSRIYVAVTYVYDLLLLALCTVALVSSTFNIPVFPFLVAALKSFIICWQRAAGADAGCRRLVRCSETGDGLCVDGKRLARERSSPFAALFGGSYLPALEAYTDHFPMCDTLLTAGKTLNKFYYYSGSENTMLIVSGSTGASRAANVLTPR